MKEVTKTVANHWYHDKRRREYERRQAEKFKDGHKEDDDGLMGFTAPFIGVGGVACTLYMSGEGFGFIPTGQVDGF